MQHTRATKDLLFPAIGQDIVTNRRAPILRLVADSSPGSHDRLIAACDRERYRLLGVEGHHIPVAGDGTLAWRAAATRPSDSVTVEAQMACWVIVSAYPQDIVVINNHQPSGIRLEQVSAP